MKTLEYGDYVYCIGQRVAAQIGSKSNWYYGIIAKLKDAETVVVRFDAGAPQHKKRECLLSSVVPVINWKMDDKPHSFEELTVTTLPLHKTVSHAKIDLNAHLFDGLWSYTNQILFKGVLRHPAWKFTANLKTLGVCHNTGIDGSKPTLMEISKRNMSAYNSYETLVHEMVHQYNFEQKKVNDGHGPLFKYWQGPIKSLLNMKLEQMADLEEMDTKIDLSKTRKSKKLKYYAVISYPIFDEHGQPTPIFCSIGFKSRGDAMQYYVDWQNYSERQTLMSAVFKRAVTERAMVGGNMPSLYQVIYDKPYVSKYNREETILTFYSSDNANADKIMQKLSAKVSDKAYMKELLDQFVYGVKNVSSFSYLTKDQVHQLDGKEIASLGYSKGVIHEWVGE